MSEGATTIVARRLPDGTVVRVMPEGSTQPRDDRTDRARLSAMTEGEIEAKAWSDADNPPLTEDEQARMRPGWTPKVIRERLDLTQEEFAARFDIPLGTLRDWEQARREPDAAALAYLRVIEREPEAVARALAAPPEAA